MQSQIESGSLSLAIDVYRRLKCDQKNLVVSPFSLTAALSMTLMGCRGRTSDELSKTLFGAVISPDKFKSLAEEFNTLVGKAVKANDKVLSVANFMYPHREFGLLPDFKQTLEKNFAAKAVEVDFNKSQETVNTINKDISEATRGKIPQLLEEVSADTRLIIANAVYFKGFWKSQFSKEDTKQEGFTMSNGKQIQVDMMYQNSKQRFSHSDELKCSALQLFFESSNTSLILLLPDKSTSLKSLESSLTPTLLDKLIRTLRTHEVDIAVPRFKMESKHALVPFLKALGINDLFNESACDLSGLAENSSNLCVTDVIQQAVIEVNEEGAEAAAATAVTVTFCSMVYYDQAEFRADRPFLYLLVSQDHQNKNLILFMGAVEDPRN